ncbi:MAG: putative ABC transporter permease subunit [Solirubrobacterales bacterium]
MNNVILLTKILLKNGSGSFGSGNGKKSNRIKVMFIIAFAVCLPLIITIVEVVSSIFGVLKGINQQGLIIALALPITVMIIFLFGVSYTINTFYFSTDIEILLPMPLKQSEILLAKFLTVLVYEYITEGVVLIPVFLIYGFRNQEFILFYLFSMVIFLLLPVIPLTAASIMDMIIMRFTNIAKNKDLFRIAGGILAMFIALGANVFFQRFTATLNSSDIAELLSKGNNSLIGAMGSLFPSTKTAVYALINSSSGKGILYLLIFVSITLAAVIIFIFLGNMLYFKGVIGISETSSKRRTIGSIELVKILKERPAVYSYMIKELKLLYRSPVYFINCVLMNFLWSVFLLIPFFAHPKMYNDTSGFINNIQGKGADPMIVAAGFVISVFITSSNMITSTAISREGRNIIFMKYIPVSYEKQLLGKVLSGVAMGLIGIIFFVPVGIFFIKIRLSIILLALLTGIFGVVFSALCGIIIDVSFPKLNWDTEQKAVKQNLNGTILIFGSMGLGALVIILTQISNLNIMFLSIALMFTFGIINCILYSMLKGYCVKKLNQIDI